MTPAYQEPSPLLVILVALALACAVILIATQPIREAMRADETEEVGQ